MSTKNKPLTTKPSDSTVLSGSVGVPSGEAMRNLAGFFDVLIQMDLTLKQRNHMEKKYDSTVQPTSTDTTETN